MSRQYSEDNGSMVGGSFCSYATLSTYNNANGMQVPRPVGTATGYIVPSYGAPGYNTLVHSQDSAGYPNIGSAYRNNNGSCNQQYVRKLCQ